MESKQMSNYVKFLLDLGDFKQSLTNKTQLDLNADPSKTFNADRAIPFDQEYESENWFVNFLQVVCFFFIVILWR